MKERFSATRMTQLLHKLQCYKNDTASSQTSGSRNVRTACTFVHALKILIQESREKCVKVRTPQHIHTSFKYTGVLMNYKCPH